MVYSFFVLLQIYLQHPDKAAKIHNQLFNCGLSVVNSLVFIPRPKFMQSSSEREWIKAKMKKVPQLFCDNFLYCMKVSSAFP